MTASTVSRGVKSGLQSIADPNNLKSASNVLASGATISLALGQPEIAAPLAALGTIVGYLAAIQDDNPVQAVAVET